MQRLLNKTILAAAALAVATGTISAQSMKAEIPFPFRVGSQLMQPGEYRVSAVQSNSGTMLWTLTSIGVKQTTILGPGRRTDPSREWIAARVPRLSFTCSDGPCTLWCLWTGGDGAYTFSSKRGKDGEMHTTEIVMRPMRAD